MVIPATERRSRGYSSDAVVSPEQAEAVRSTLYRTDETTSGHILDALPERLSVEHLEFFATHGYLAANSVLKPDEVQEYMDGLTDLVRRKTAWDNRVWSQEEPYFAHGGRDARLEDPEL